MDASPEEILAMADQLSAMAKATAANPADKLQRAAVVLQAKQMISRVQDPFDALMDHVVHAYTIAAGLALMEIGVFEGIPASGSIHSKELAQKCGADEDLIIRLMRQLTCVNIFNEVATSEWAHNRLSVGMSEHLAMTGKYFFEVCMDEMLPSMLRLNRYIRQYGKKDVLTYTETPHSWYDNKLGKNFWEVLSSDPSRIQRFSRGLSLFAALHPVVAMFPFEEALKPGNSADRVLAVDIGGGRGLALLELRQGCPSLKGQLILQDRDVVLDDIKEEDLPGVTKIAHDFFTQQPVKGAQVYYIRRVMHDWQDAEAVKILKAIVPAMAKDSRILLSDMAIPDPVTPIDAGAVWMDLMMLTIGGKERTKRDWEKLANMADLKLVKIWQEPMKYGPLCVVEYMLKDGEVAAPAAMEQETNGLTSQHGKGEHQVNGATGETHESKVEAVTSGFSQAEITTSGATPAQPTV